MAKYIQKCPYFGAIDPYQGYISAETLFAKNQIFHKNSYKGKKTDLWTNKKRKDMVTDGKCTHFINNTTIKNVFPFSL